MPRLMDIYQDPTLTHKDKALLLQDIAVANRRIGPAISTKIFSIMTGLDPKSIVSRLANEGGA